MEVKVEVSISVVVQECLDLSRTEIPSGSALVGSACVLVAAACGLIDAVNTDLEGVVRTGLSNFFKCISGVLIVMGLPFSVTLFRWVGVWGVLVVFGGVWVVLVLCGGVLVWGALVVCGGVLGALVVCGGVGGALAVVCGEEAVDSFKESLCISFLSFVLSSEPSAAAFRCVGGVVTGHSPNVHCGREHIN